MKLLATLAVFLFSGIVNAITLHNVVVFGDSLSDNGNLYEYMKHQLPQSPPYYSGRFSNGPVWIEFLMESYYPSAEISSHLLDYAIGGAGVSEEDDDDGLFTLKKEVSTYLLTHEDKADADTLYVVWIGSNNYLGLSPEVDKTLKAVNDGVAHSLQLLAEKGAKHFFIMNLPALGRIPAAHEFDAVDMLTYYSKKNNEDLLNTINQLKTTYPDVNWVLYDLHTMFNHLLDHPDEYGLTNVKDTCVNSLSLMKPGSKPSILSMVARVQPGEAEKGCAGYLYFDLVHPTGGAHKILAQKTKAFLDEVGIKLE